jgi:Arc/MetJ-type ribon-helix-helix transcriptional regulator
MTKDDVAWLRAQVAAGHYGSVEEAVAEAIEALRSEHEGFAWVRPLIAEGLEQPDSSEAVPARDVFAAIEARLRQRRPGRWKGRLTVPERLLEPLTDEELVWLSGERSK